MRVSDYVLWRLAEEGIDTAFLVYGGAVSELCDAFTRQSRIRYVVCIHEQACSFAAEGYAKTKGVPGLAIGTSGPGGQNMITGIANCWFDSTPAIFITGQVNSQFIRANDSVRQLGFQEWPCVDVVKPITKYAFQPRTAHDAMHALNDAIILCKRGRPGPVLLDLPGDVQKLTLPGGESCDVP